MTGFNGSFLFQIIQPRLFHLSFSRFHDVLVVELWEILFIVSGIVFGFRFNLTNI